jgi:hypothetical protein
MVATGFVDQDSVLSNLPCSMKAPVMEDQKLKKVRGRRGILCSLRVFPMDVVTEIFSHLNPMDLLNLARATKEIHSAHH